MPDLSNLNFRVSEERMKGLKIGVMRKIETSVNAQFEFVAHFMTDEDGEYYSKDGAYEILDEYELGDVEEIAEQLQEAMENIVPKG